ncbi:MAG: flavodoxin family protein [Anaerolineae bacterium]
MKVIGISGSPRRGGNTETLLREVLRGAEEAGAETRLFILSRMNISPCRHCDGCLAEGVCVVKDDMGLIYPEIESLDALVLASPIHFYGVTAQAKAMIDRCQAFWARKYVLKRRIASKKRKGVFVSVGGTRLPDLFEHAKATVKIFFRTIDVVYWAELLVPGVDSKGEIREHPAALKDAYLLGRRLVEEEGSEGGLDNASS